MEIPEKRQVHLDEDQRAYFREEMVNRLVRWSRGPSTPMKGKLEVGNDEDYSSYCSHKRLVVQCKPLFKKSVGRERN